MNSKISKHNRNTSQLKSKEAKSKMDFLIPFSTDAENL